MSKTWIFLAMAFLAGAVTPLQAGINSTLRLWVGHPIWAALVNFGVGTVALLSSYFFLRLPRPSAASLSRAPWYSWLGGLLGAFVVASTVVLAPRLGAAVLIALIIAGQLIVSLLLDHLGILGFPHHPVNLWRIVGALLLLAGVLLIQRF